MDKFLVTGGAGFIGSHFVRLLIRSRHHVVNLDKITYSGDLRNLIDLTGNRYYEFVKGDICSSSVVAPLMKECDAVVNFAAESHVDRSISDARRFLATDTIGTGVLLEAARRYDKRFLQISTDEVYGPMQEGSSNEFDPLNPSSPYSASKAAADLFVRAYVVTYGLDAGIVRSSNNYGPNQHPEKLIPKLITAAIKGNRLPLYGDGLNVREWLFVVDNCKAIKAVCEKGKKGEIFNVGSGVEMKNIEVAKQILRRLGKSEELIILVGDRPGHDRRYSLDSSRVRSLGWAPQTTFEQGIARTIRWYSENVDWWADKIDHVQASL